MAFDPSKFQVSSTSQKYMPVVLLLDVSGSMEGDKINNLYAATCEMIKSFADFGKTEVPFKVAIITFGGECADCHTRYTDAKDLQNLSAFNAYGMTPLGKALEMAKDMIEDKTETPSRWYRPVVILVSDGQPNDDYEEPMRAFLNEGRTAKCQRMSMGIGSDADYQMLERFASESSLCFRAEDAADIKSKMKLIETITTNHAKEVSNKQAAGKNPNDFPGANVANDKPKNYKPQADDEYDDE